MIYAYARISVDKESSVAVEDQLRKLQAYALATDRPIDREFIDRDASGRSMKRPQMLELLSIIKPGDTIMVHKLDRLTRNVRDLGDLLARNINIVSVVESLDTQTASGRLVVNILGTVAQWEREVIVERTTASLGYKRENLQVYGKAPFGYKAVDGKLVTVPQEMRILCEMQRMRNEGSSYHAISNFLNDCYPEIARGKRWYPASVKSILDSKMAAS